MTGLGIERDLVLAYDLGTGGCKASLWTPAATMLAETVVPYPTSHPAPGRNEQAPADWWDAVAASTRHLLERSPGARERIAGIALSGQSLGAVQLDERGELVAPTTPIWSDTRGRPDAVFGGTSEAEWYRRTGNGFGAALYPLTKAAAFRADDPDAWGRTRHLVGSKDWINLRLTGELATDPSMASGSGAYDLATGGYDDELLAAAELPQDVFPRIVPSSERVGWITAAAAGDLGLPTGIPVFAGAVDNAAMALGSRGTAEGRIYAALGSSSWITVTSARPVIDDHARPYVFAHAIPGLFISALSTFSSGTSLEWLHQTLAPGTDTATFIDLAAGSVPGARGVSFVPTLAGGTPLEGGSDVRGGFTGLHLGAGPADLVRACLEGIAFSLDRSLARMRELSGSREPLLITGGGSRSALWNRVYADILRSPLQRSTVDQQAATLGAAAIAFVGLGIWDDYARADAAHTGLDEIVPADPESYADARGRFDAAVSALASLTPTQENPS
ncbi:FGGY-family carbohydrate kinase [Microbacterium sp. cf332]|uniref:xylulokinase n=1 Tax=Microbacterium sp. cf332 TaxID=1761804 RepID=UPI0008850422|nr:FGGY family carbohydrate kinase [Microbacterium sp. cf332]SDQ52949.1 xylulokinase [Microbacterium sp. cf332]